MHRAFQAFIDRLFESTDRRDFHDAMADIASAFGLQFFAYLLLRGCAGASPELISSYPPDWTAHYFRNRYEHLDPVILWALRTREPFEWVRAPVP